MADEKKDEKKKDAATPEPVKPPQDPGEKVLVLKFNHRFGNVNAGEQAGYPEKQAKELLAMEVDRPGVGKVAVCTLVKEAKLDPKTGGIIG